MAKKPKVPKTPYIPPDEKDQEAARERERNRRNRMQGAGSTIKSPMTTLGGKTGSVGATKLGAGTGGMVRAAGMSAGGY